jgi:HEAT repeat protein
MLPSHNLPDNQQKKMLPIRRTGFARTVRSIFSGIGLALLLTCLEAVLWIMNPGRLFDGGSHTLATFLALPARVPLLLLVPLGEAIAGLCVALAVAQPLALLAYLKAVRKAQEEYRTRYTPLQASSYPYDVPILYTFDNPDPTLPRSTRSLQILELIETTMTGSSTHLLLLGAPGAGKTLFVREYLSTVAQHRREVISRKRKVPLFVPLTYYILFLQAFDLADSAEFSLLDFLFACDLPGLDHLRPYLGKLFQQGRLFFLCDALDEVPEIYRPALEQELILLFRQNRNGLLLTCAPEVYEQSPELVQVIGENLVPRAVLQPLEQVHMRGIVERFIAEVDARAQVDLPTAGQVMSALERTRLRFICATPLYLFALLELISRVPVDALRNLDTRGRLLHAFLVNHLEASSLAVEVLPEDMLFLRDLACVARWNGENDVVCLPEEAFLALRVPERQSGGEGSIQQALLRWSHGQPVRFPFAENAISALAETFPPDQAIPMLQRLYRAALIDINPQGVLSFRHSLITSTLLAEYLAAFLGTGTLRIEEIETFPEDLVSWSEPLTLWAGLLDYPMEAVDTLAMYAREHPEQRASALLASLICLGVAQTPPGVERQHPLFVPPALEAALEELLDDQLALAELAALLTHCAGHGSPELYQALFPLLAIKRIEALFELLDPALLSELFFQRLEEVIDDTEQETLVKLLVRALSSLGQAVVPRAAWLCAAGSGAGGRLRTAAINILGGTRDRDAVEPLLACLRDPDQFISARAANALTRLGPELTLQRLIQELEMRSPASGLILPIIERFFNETSPERQLTPAQFERAIDALMALLSTHTDLADLEKARAILVSQGRLAEERESGQIAIRRMVQNLATADDTVARSMTGTLKAVGPAATPRLLEQLEQQSSETERVRILEVLASVRDRRALPALLRLLADNSLAVQQTLATTLAVYVPICIPGLIDVALRHPDELVATRAEQVLGRLGEVVVDPVIQALNPPVAGRTRLLVHTLEVVRDLRAVPALIALLRDSQSDVALALAIVQALGQLSDERVVPPLLDVLNSANPLLYEGAINALSNLGELACPALLKRLDTSEKTPLVARVKRVLLGMQPLPGEQLLQTLDEGSANQGRGVEELLLQRGGDAAQLLAMHLFDERPRVRLRARQIMSRMDGRYTVPALLEILGNPDPARRELTASYLLNHPQEAIPPLVGLLDDPARGEAAVSILLRAGKPVLPALVPALDASQEVVQERASHILVTLVQQQEELLADAVQLFGLALPPRACELLVRLLTEDLADFSLPALLAGLEDAHLVPDVSTTLVRLARRNPARGPAVLEELLQALRVKNRRYGASLTLIELGSEAVPGVGALITDTDSQVAQSARHILAEIGVPAFSFLWAAHSDASNPARREAAREVFRAMPTAVIKDELVALLTSARQEEISMALVLLLERIHDEARQSGQAGEMLPALLEHVQSSADERASLRILALLILLGGPAVNTALVDALYANPQRHEHLVQTFLLLGKDVEADLLAILRDEDAPIQLQAEAAGILAMRSPHKEVQERALRLSEYGLWAGRSAYKVTTALQPSQLEISLRALGGLLVAGHWDSPELQDRRSASKPGSAERELYDILLGWRYSPQITRLEDELAIERNERKQELVAYTQELLALKTHASDLEHDLESLKQEHEEQHRSHEQKAEELEAVIERLTREKQDLQADLRQVLQEKQALAASSQQAAQEKTRAQAELERWKTYSLQLERDLNALRRPE